MTKIVALCGASASGKTMICSHFLEKYPHTHYIATTTAKVREKFDNPSYEYLMSPQGNSLMREYQTAIANNLWDQLFEAFAISQLYPSRYDYILLDRSPLDAYIYEELFSVIANKSKSIKLKTGTPHVAFKAFGRLFESYNLKRIEDFPEHLYIVGLTSLFASNDPKRPSAAINQKYTDEVRRIFNLGKVANYPRLTMAALPNTDLKIDKRIELLATLLQDHSK